MCVGMAWPLAAANDANDFYTSLLHRGIGHVDAGQYEAGQKELRIAAFGLVDAIAELETAEVYLTIAGDRLHSEADSRRALQRIIAADRVQRRFGSLNLPEKVHADFDKIASKLLTSDQYAFLKASPTAAAGTTMTMTPQHSSAPMPVPQPAISNPKPPPVVAPAPVPAPVPVPQPVPPPVKHTVRQQPPTPQPPAPAPVLTSNALIANADKAVDNNDLAAARKMYDQVVADPSLDHTTLIHLGMQSYRARDFATAVRAFGRSGFGGSEAPYRYYYAVALYETGQPAAAKRELTQALPYIEITPDVAAYRDKIENAR
jgi:tetratricopeptide (TPR) repeat protein